MKTCCVVVIGHVDHGKTSLVRAITGTETDRLPEEKARGLSITPGFAHRTYPSGTIDFIDAPGHEDFIQAMISGASGATAALVVISAVDGISAQTREHLRIAGLLGITRGVVAVNKSDLLDPSERAARLNEIQIFLSQTQLSDVPVVLCSAQTGDGLDTLDEAFEALLPQAISTLGPPESYVAIDRAFSLPGQGTIVTGTLQGQDLSVDDKAVLHPTGQDVTIRSLQSRGAQRDHIQVGERMAANLRGVTITDIPRGAVLCTDRTAKSANCIDVHLQLLPTATMPLKHMESLRVMFGTSSEVAQVRLLGAGQIAPAHSGFAQLRFKTPVIGFAGQRAVLRRLSPKETIGGATLLDPQARTTGSGDKTRIHVLEAAHIQDTKQIAQALSEAIGGLATLSDIARLSRSTMAQVRAVLGDAFENTNAEHVSSKQTITACSANIMNALTAYHDRFPLRTMAPRTALINADVSPKLIDHVATKLVANGQIRQQGPFFVTNDHDPFEQLSTNQRGRMIEIEDTILQAAMSSPTSDSVSQDTLDPDLIALLIDRGSLVALRNVALKQTLLIHTDTLKAAISTLQDTFPPTQSFTTSQARTTLTTSRKVIVPVLEHFDQAGVTIRDGDARHMANPNSVLTTDPSC